MSSILALLLDNWQVIAGAVGAIAMFLFGRKSANKKHKARKAKANADTNERINNRTPVDPTDRPDIVDRLRKHGQ